MIAAVTNFGVFVELHDLYIEGLLHVSALPGDYYHFDQAKQRLVGERTRQVFSWVAWSPSRSPASISMIAKLILNWRWRELKAAAGAGPRKPGEGKKAKTSGEG